MRSSSLVSGLRRHPCRRRSSSRTTIVQRRPPFTATTSNHDWVPEVDVSPTATASTTASSSTSSTSNQHHETMANAIRPYFELQTPVVLRGAGANTPAFRLWQPNESLISTLQDRIPPHMLGAVEIGGSYSSTATDRAEIPIHDYLHYLRLFEERHGSQGSTTDPWQVPDPTVITKDELVYMAQNDLPESLYPDIEIPAFCCQEQEDVYQVGHGRLYSVMLWLGPRACVSPLHFDPLDNILMQFVGRKVVWLYDPNNTTRQSENGAEDAEIAMWHYAGHEGQQSNTSPVNPESVDAQKYPLFVQHSPPAQRCVLHPGDFLYIPSKWWHFVRSVDTSASVNVWWR